MRGRKQPSEGQSSPPFANESKDAVKSWRKSA
ncbi:hypothetical protein F383_37213 [Gossypium arboreum]|uniref:Uncharacterized protein n=1 Tax=Gossypium arboreum TaxID=29729 RepID=A0A0B0MF35_GOSAR|nr:hypothetical protein F383_37213 [Gossypium arboreum]